jgi:hypothetical protein
MTAQLAALFACRVGSLDRSTVRLVRQGDERRILQICEGAAVTQLELSGRPDGLRPGGFETFLDLLHNRPPRAHAAMAVTPQEWMELDREFTQYGLRRRAALVAAAEAHLRHDATTALQLYRVAARDAQHGQEIIAFAAKIHPRGQMSATRPEARPTLQAQQCLADTAMCVLSDDFGGALACVRAGIQQVVALLRAAGESDPLANACVRELTELEFGIRAAAAQPEVSTLGMPISLGVSENN